MSEWNITSQSTEAGVAPGDTLIIESTVIKLRQGTAESLWAASYTVENADLLGVANGKDFRIRFDDSRHLTCTLSVPASPSARRAVQAVTLGTVLGTLAGFLVGLAAQAPLLGTLTGLTAALISSFSTGAVLGGFGDRLITTGGFVAEEGKEGERPVIDYGTSPHGLRIAGKR